MLARKPEEVSQHAKSLAFTLEHYTIHAAAPRGGTFRVPFDDTGRPYKIDIQRYADNTVLTVTTDHWLLTRELPKVLGKLGPLFGKHRAVLKRITADLYTITIPKLAATDTPNNVGTGVIA